MGLANNSRSKPAAAAGRTLAGAAEPTDGFSGDRLAAVNLSHSFGGTSSTSTSSSFVDCGELSLSAPGDVMAKNTMP